MRRREDLSADDAGLHELPEIIFSLDNGVVWASRPGLTPIELGEYEVVKMMMQDFLDQSALGERLSSRIRNGSKSRI
jgi:hypothetical protein